MSEHAGPSGVGPSGAGAPREGATGPRPGGAARGLALSARGLVVRGEGGRVLLDLPALDVAPGEALAVAGPSGAGKSTLLHALSGLVRVHAGSVRWGEGEGAADLAALPEARRAAFRRRHLGLVFQDHLLFEELGAPRNAALAAAWAPAAERGAILGRARALLARLGLPDEPRRAVTRFSGGERQRIAVARALACDPSAVLADEPTASLDRASAEALADALLRLAEEDGRTLVVATHDEALLARAHRVLRLMGGRPMEEPAGDGGGGLRPGDGAPRGAGAPSRALGDGARLPGDGTAPVGGGDPPPRGPRAWPRRGGADPAPPRRDDPASLRGRDPAALGGGDPALVRGGGARAGSEDEAGASRARRGAAP